MSYPDSVDWLFQQFPAYQLVGTSAYKPDLDNILELCAHFDIDYSKLKYIHVAGTNGKGSTSNFLASILQETGYKTGLFTSPHILDFRERIRVNGNTISEQEVIDFCELVQSSHLSIKPSFFEITWLLALKHFISQNCEICVIETGLGGRLDSTNIITPLLSIITNIGLDHVSILGNSLEQIAFEKAGIIKAGVPCVLGENQPEIHSVFTQKAFALGSVLHLAYENEVENPVFQIGTYSYKNERTVRKAISVLQKLGFSITATNIQDGLQNVAQNTGFRGRFQILSQHPLIIADAAHNEDGIRSLIAAISLQEYDKLWVIYGASNDKNVLEILALFPPETHFLFSPFENQRSLSTIELAELQKNIAQKSNLFDSVASAFAYGQQVVNENDILLITGSFFLLSDFFSHFSAKDL